MGHPMAATALLCQLGLSAAIQWLGLAESGGGVAWNESQQCQALARLVPAQSQMCQRNVEVMQSVARAARRTVDACQETFKGMRWNCSSIRRAPRFGPDLLRGTRESAFVHALAAAALAHSVARACSSGELPLCSCGTLPPQAPPEGPPQGPPVPRFRWGGCGDNLGYGLRLGAAFADGASTAGQGGTRALRAVSLHNNNVGRQVVSDSLDTKCKCHGVSGSCSVKTCWKGLPNLEEIASELKSKYLTAIKVTHRLVGPRKQLVPKEMGVGPVREVDLLYLLNSPDYCTPNLHLGSLGTQERQCNRTSVGSGSCDLLCCGRGYNTYTEEVVERCHCRYHWCCHVVCKRCRRAVERHVCK